MSSTAKSWLRSNQRGVDCGGQPQHDSYVGGWDTINPHIEFSRLRFDRAVLVPLTTESGNGAGEERFTFVGLDHANTVQVAKAGDMKIVEFGFRHNALLKK